jgi:hypothetical protein
MKVYTYYENINFSDQDELLELWKKSWSDKGFEAIVLTKADAEKHPFYTEFIDKLIWLNRAITEKPLNEYGLACWVRWLAYATQPEEKFYVCDYDVINQRFMPTELSENLHLMDDVCPCIASGTPSQFEALCKTIISFTENNLEKIKEIYKERKYKHFHDQEFFEISLAINSSLFKTSRFRETFLATPITNNFWLKPLVHYGTNLCKKYFEQNFIEFTTKSRVSLIKEHLFSVITHCKNQKATSNLIESKTLNIKISY